SGQVCGGADKAGAPSTCYRYTRHDARNQIPLSTFLSARRRTSVNSCQQGLLLARRGHRSYHPCDIRSQIHRHDGEATGIQLNNLRYLRNLNLRSPLLIVAALSSAIVRFKNFAVKGCASRPYCGRPLTSTPLRFELAYTKPDANPLLLS